MPTRWTNRLSQNQIRVLSACDGRGVLGYQCKRGILPVFVDELRTVKALFNRKLVRSVNVPEYPFNGITLTQLGAETLCPPGLVIYPEKSVTDR